MSKNGGYPSKRIHLCEIFHKEKYLSLEKVIPIAKFANHYGPFSERMAYKGGCIVGFLNPPE